MVSFLFMVSEIALNWTLNSQDQYMLFLGVWCNGITWEIWASLLLLAKQNYEVIQEKRFYGCNIAKIVKLSYWSSMLFYIFTGLLKFFRYYIQTNIWMFQSVKWHVLRNSNLFSVWIKIKCWIVVIHVVKCWIVNTHVAGILFLNRTMLLSNVWRKENFCSLWIRFICWIVDTHVVKCWIVDTNIAGIFFLNRTMLLSQACIELVIWCLVESWALNRRVEVTPKFPFL